MIDYNRGLHTPQSLDKKAQKPSEIWDDLYANWHQLDSEDHKKDMNWFLFQQRLLKLYDEHKKPIFTLLGNHD
uniref:Calcineurin-like phosphoesterase domain-containing protein n=1 Tax=uncultured organism TaxID=155900 RepID=M1PR39_9ZZZZ|nr:hypothetical protein FLSS-16_0026 [uncultured organism]